MITEAEIEEKLARLRGKVPNFLIEDLKERLVKKKDILTPEQVDKIVDRVLRVYAGQIQKLSRLENRVEEIGRYLEEIRNYLMNATSQGQVQSDKPAQPVQEERPQPEGGAPAVESSGATGVNGNEVFSEGPLGSTSMTGVTEKLPGGGVMDNDAGISKGFEIPQEIRDVLISPTRTRARLERIPNDMVSIMMALKWLGFLIERVGMQNLEEVLEFYYQIGWISEEVLNTLLRYAEGIRPHHREPDWRPDEKLTIQDHLVSLLFIERLRGVKITRELLDAIERELRTISRVLEEVYGV